MLNDLEREKELKKEREKELKPLIIIPINYLYLFI